MKKMRFKGFFFLALSLLILVFLSQVVASDSKVQNVSTYSELKAVLTNPKGGHAKLTGDIYISHSEVGYETDIAFTLGRDASYILDLNGHVLYFHFNHSGREFDDHGTVISTGFSNLLTIKGPGTIFGGETAIEKDGHGELIVDGATLTGMMAQAIWHKWGLTHLKAGTIRGNFSDVTAEFGLVIKEAGVIGDVMARFPSDTRTFALIENGILTGNVELEDSVLVIDNLTIAEGSSFTLEHQAGLVVKNKFVNNGKYTFKEGLESIGGKATMKADSQTVLRKSITIDTLKIENHGILAIENGASLTINKELENYGGLDNRKGKVVLKGTYSGAGWVEGVPEIEEQIRPSEPAEPEIDTSVPAKWAIEAVESARDTWFKDSHLLSRFQNNINREEYAELVVRLYESIKGEHIPLPEVNPFNDCDLWHVQQAYHAGLISGRGDGVFDPFSPITRQETAKMFDNLFNALGIDPIVTQEYIEFKDEEDIASYAKAPMQLMYKLEIILGEGDNVMAPLKKSSREMAIVIGNRIFERFGAEE
ncbi:MAG: S-layer homology domain-containing protein [Firmicutes bacterium]|jgi:hypothetical protein|nr:S-layer homology domain-containing protein [Bacillota bacterium]